MGQSEFKAIAPSQHQLREKYGCASCDWFCFCSESGTSFFWPIRDQRNVKLKQKQLPSDTL